MSGAMRKIKTQGDRLIDQSFVTYYAGGTPNIYERLHQSESGAYPGVIAGANLSYTMRIGYEPSQTPGYSTGMHPSGAVVFEWMVNGSMGVVGSSGFANLALGLIYEVAVMEFASAFG